MTPALVAVGALAAAGAALVLAEHRWFRRPPMADRLRPYLPPTDDRRPRSAAARRDVAGELARHVGSRLAALLGVREELSLRLRRVHSSLTPTAFRLRQLAWAAAAGAASVAVLAVARPPALVVVIGILGAPLLAFLVVEQQLAAASARQQRVVFLELPVVGEQLAMLLGSGFSLGSALGRLAARGHGACARDLGVVRQRTQQGVSETRALQEWAETMRVDALDRLVAVLCLHREAGDLSSLIGAEARAIRAEVHRELLETIERRSQQVWIPVTVATLVPGVLFIAVPFVDALRLFGAA